MVGAALLIFYVQVKLLQVCGPLLVVVILQFPLCLHKLQGLVVSVNNRLFAQDVMLPLSASLDNGVHFLVIGGVLSNCI
jgi:hypothetical protein